MLKTFINETSLLDREVYDFYRDNRRHVAKGINDYNLFKKAVGGLLTVIKEMMIEGEGGVHIDGIGYFCFLKNTKKVRRRGRIKSLIKKYKKVYTYTPYFFPDIELEGWTFSDTFDMKTLDKDRFRDDYKIHLDLCQSLRVNNHYNKRVDDSKDENLNYIRRF
jgi:hypothetical protein